MSISAIAWIQIICNEFVLRSGCNMLMIGSKSALFWILVICNERKVFISLLKIYKKKYKSSGRQFAKNIYYLSNILA